MANKLSTAITAIIEALGPLVVDGTFRAVHRRLINPFTEMQLPVAGVRLVRWRRTNGQQWEAEILIMLVGRLAQDASEETEVGLAGKVDAKLKALADAGTAGGVIEAPTWEPWPPMRNDGNLAPVGALGGLKLVVDDPLE